jgi:uncharacterized protein (TIGR02677 family)
VNPTSEAPTVQLAPGSIRAFAYVTTEKATLYRAIMQVFVDAKAGFTFQLRPAEVLQRTSIPGVQESPDQSEIESALEQLCSWGNLEAHLDTADVSKVEDFYKQRCLYQITNQGEAAQRALDAFQGVSTITGELRTSALNDVKELLQELVELAKQSTRDPGQIRRRLLALRAAFEDLSTNAYEFMSTLQRKIDLQVAQSGDSISEKQRLIEYVQRFVGELVIGTDEIARMIRQLDAAGLDTLLHAAAASSGGDAMENDPEQLERSIQQWRSGWDRLRDWFISRPGQPSNADTLRSHARASIPALLNVISSMDARLITRIDRTNDLRVLARWFIEAESEAEAHKLWRAVFGLCPARHLLINDATLDEHEAQDVSPDTGWLEAAPLKTSPRLRGYGSSRTGGLTRIIDRSAEKQKLAAAMHEEAMRILRAQNRFASGTRIRLSEVAELDVDEFDLFLDLLGEAVSAKVLASDTPEIVSSDGSLRVRLEPIDDSQPVAIHTPDGIFTGPDHWISVDRNSAEEELR